MLKNSRSEIRANFFVEKRFIIIQHDVVYNIRSLLSVCGEMVRELSLEEEEEAVRKREKWTREKKHENEEKKKLRLKTW